MLYNALTPVTNHDNTAYKKSEVNSCYPLTYSAVICNDDYNDDDDDDDDDDISMHLKILFADK